MPRKNEGSGQLEDLTLTQADRLSRRLGRAAARLPRDKAGTETAIEIYEVAHDIHNAWTEKSSRGAK